jgi:asparagine N-glycosylation enzyme membrane subunit Stt3
MALPDTWSTTSPREGAALDAALTQLADRFLAYQQSVQAIMAGYAGVVAADLTAAPFGKTATVAAGLVAGMATLNTHAADAGANAVIGHLRNVGR